jgi:hypothetical protein
MVHLFKNNGYCKLVPLHNKGELNDSFIYVYMPQLPHRLSAHPASHPMGTGGDVPGGKAAGAWN